LQYENTYLKPIVKNGVKKIHPDELDVIALIQKGLSFFDHFKIILLSFSVAGLASGLYFYFDSPRQYSTRLIAHSMFLSNQEEIGIVDNWKALLSKGGKSQLAGVMNCNARVVKKLSSISAEEILKVYASDNPNGFIINVTVTDTSILDELQNGIVYGLNNSPYVKEKLVIRKTRDNDLIKRTTEEIEKLNAFKALASNLIQTKSKNTAPVMIDISRTSAETIDLNEKLLSYREDLKFLTGIHVLENFNKGKLERHGLLKFPFLGIATGLFIGYLISLLLFARQKMKAISLNPATS
jgi:hypothetical protein